MELAPIVLFVYNRPDHTLRTLEALSNNLFANQSVLFIYADGPKESSSNESLKNIEETRKVIRSKNWCKEVNIVESTYNQGLANSIIHGVTDVVKKFGKVIVLEDDIVTSPLFLDFMNKSLNFYALRSEVMHVSGYMYPHNQKLPATFYFNVPLCWGWGTWERAWRKFDPDVNKYIKYLNENNLWKNFDKFGGNYLSEQLIQNASGEINTWFIKWHASVFLHNGFCLFPSKSFVENIGFDSTGEHCHTTNEFYSIVSKNVDVSPIPLMESKKAEDIIKTFYSSLGKTKSNSLSKRALLFLGRFLHNRK